MLVKCIFYMSNMYSEIYYLDCNLLVPFHNVREFELDNLPTHAGQVQIPQPWQHQEAVRNHGSHHQVLDGEEVPLHSLKNINPSNSSGYSCILT